MSAVATLDLDERRDDEEDEVEFERGGLGEVLTTAQAAKRAKWKPRRMRRFLTAKNEEFDGALLVNIGRGKQRPRWTVAVAALKMIAPQWFHDPETMQQDIECLKGEIEEARVLIAHLTRRLDQQTARIVDIANARGSSAPPSRFTPPAASGSRAVRPCPRT